MKLPTSSAIVFTCAATLVFSNTLDERISHLEQQMKEASVQTVFGNTGANTAPASPRLEYPIPFVLIEMLYWKPFFGGNEYGYTDSSFPVAQPFNGKIVQMNSDWQFGFKMGLGYRFTAIDWSLGAEFTRLKFHDHHSSGSSLSASGLPDAGNESSAHAKWKISFNVLDFYLARPYFLRPRLSMEPRMGLRTAWIHQNDHEQYFNTLSGVNPWLKNNNLSKGIGIFGGTAAHWHWCRQWGLYGGASASLIYGKIKCSTEASDPSNSPSVLDVSADTYKVLPNCELHTGLQWNYSWKVATLLLAAGYDFQYWWGQNQRPHLKYNTDYSWLRYNEDLGFQGFSLTAALNY